MLRPLLATIALLSAGLLQAAETPADDGELLDRVVAIVNEGIVTQSELEELESTTLAQLRRQNIALPPSDVLRKQALDRLILQQLQLQHGERMGVDITDEQLNQQLAAIAEGNGMTLAQLPQALAQQGITYARFRETLRDEMVVSVVRRREVLDKINVTPRELEQFMERLRKLPDENAEYNISHILIEKPIDATQAQTEELARRAQEIYERTATEDFSSLAVSYSNAQKALEGGALGWIAAGNLPSGFAEVIVGLKPGQVAKPLDTPNGFQIIKLNEVRSKAGDPVQNQMLTRHILMRPNALQDDATVRQKLAGLKQRVLNGEDFGAFASSMSEDTGTAVNGGELGWSGPGETVPEYEAAAAALEINGISDPFQTRYGWHIVQLLGRRQFDITEDALQQRAFSQLRESKADEESELWLRRMRDEAFVETLL